MLTIEVNGRPIEAKKGEMLITSLERAGIKVPTLCHMKDRPPTGACRICVVEIEGQKGLIPSCAYPVAEGMKVQTHSPRAVSARKTIIELLLADHPDDCLYCVRNGNCELQGMAEDLGLRRRRYAGEKSTWKMDLSSPAIERDPDKCILCGKCVRTCEEVQGVSAIAFAGRGCKTFIGTAFNEGMNISSCVYCGQCIKVCPTGALRERSSIKEVWGALNDPEMTVVVQHAPSVSVTVGEAFGVKPGADMTGAMTTALRRLGFDYVFDTSFSADLTIMEEASELVHRIKTGGKLPMMTSCSPGWIKYVEQNYPDFMGNLSSCKSPQQMMGAVVKSYFAEKMGIAPKKIFSVSIMPCTAKKFEASRAEMGSRNIPDIDAVLTTREFIRMIRMSGLDLNDLEPDAADTPFGERSTAGKLFGASGGVMEAAVRTAHYLLTGRELKVMALEAVRGMKDRKEAQLEINGMKIGIAVVNGLGGAKSLLDEIRAGRDDLHFIEVMTCSGGCINGGGQPIDMNMDAVKARMAALYQMDAEARLRTSHNNPSILRIYKEFLGEPLGPVSHKLLHTKFTERKVLS